MKTSRFLVFLLFVFLISSGCSSPESRLIGKWVGKTGSFEFFKNKTGFINPPAERTDLPSNVRFLWRVEGSDIVAMKFDLPANKTIFGKLEGKDALIVEDDKFVKQ